MASCKKDAKGRKLGKGETYRSDGRYCYSYTICGERKWLYASDLAELRELERRIEHDKDDGIRTQEASKITLNDMFGTYIATKTKIKTSTRENYLYLWNKYIRPTPLAHQSLINIKTSDIKKLYGDLLANGFRTNSLDSINNLVHPTLEMAVDDDLIRKNPSKGVYRALKEKDCKKRVALTLAQQQAFLNYVNQSPVYHHWTPIFGKCRFLISTPKTASSIRLIPMCPEVLAELAGLIAILDTLYDTPSPTIDGYTDFIFRNRYGDLLNPHSLNRAIERIIRDYNAEELKLAEEDQRPPLLLPHFSVHGTCRDQYNSGYLYAYHRGHPQKFGTKHECKNQTFRIRKTGMHRASVHSSFILCHIEFRKCVKNVSNWEFNTFSRPPECACRASEDAAFPRRFRGGQRK